MFFYYWQIVYLKKKKRQKLLALFSVKKLMKAQIEENQNGIPS